MKKGKFITAICMLVVTIACLTFGVLALTTADFTVAGTVTFNNYNCDCALDVKVLGLSPDVTEVTQDSTTKRYYKEFKFSTKARDGYEVITKSMALGDLVFDELNTEIEEEMRSEIIISISLHNYSTYPVKMSATLGTNVPNGLTVTISDEITASASIDGLTAQDGSADFTIKLNATDSLSQVPIDFATITIQPNNQSGENENMNQYLADGYVIPDISDFDIENKAIVKYKGSEPKILIPNVPEIETIMSTEEKVGANIPVFESGVTSVVMQNNINRIGYAAFCGCETLTNVVVPGSVKSIGAGAFANCQNLNELIIQDGVENIGTGMIDGSDALTTLSIPESVKYIGSYGLVNNADILYDSDGINNGYLQMKDNKGNNIFVMYFGESEEEFVVPEKTRLICGDAFRGASITSVVMPNTVRYVGDYAFAECDSLTNVVLSKNLEKVSKSAFMNCGNITKLSIPACIDVISDYFPSYSSITDITMYEGFTSIADDAFRGMSKLVNLSIPYGIKQIGNSAFMECNSLNSLKIPSSIEYLDGGPFSDCPDSLFTIIDNAKYLTDVDGNPTVLVSAKDTTITACNIAPTTRVINSHAFSGCNLSSIIIPDSIISIGALAFENCPDSLFTIIDNAKYLTDVDGNPTVLVSAKDTTITSCNVATTTKLIVGSAFFSCESLNSIIIPETVEIIPQSTFYGCTNLKTVELPNTIKVIGAQAFGEDKSLMSIIIPDAVRYIGASAFFECTSLTSLNLPNNLTKINSQTFSGSGLININIPNTVMEIGTGAFASCQNLNEVNISDGVNTIKGNVFSGCNNLHTVTIPSSVDTIDGNIFTGCNELVSISVDPTNFAYNSGYNCNAIIETNTGTLIAGCKNTIIPDTVKSIGLAAFSQCQGLTSIEIPERVVIIGRNAFAGCTNLESITIPESVVKIGSMAFWNCSNLTEVKFIYTGDWYTGISETTCTFKVTTSQTDYASNADLFKGRFCGQYWSKTQS